MNELDLSAIDARAKAATPGPWTYEYTPNGPCGAKCYADMIFSEHKYPPTNIARRPGYDSGGPRQETINADFIAHARADVPALVAEIKRLRTLLAEKVDG